MHFRRLTSILQKNNVPGQLIPMAAWIEDTLLKFYVHVGEPLYHKGDGLMTMMITMRMMMRMRVMMLMLTS